MRISELQILTKVKGKGSNLDQLPKMGREIKPEQEEHYLGRHVSNLKGLEIWRYEHQGEIQYAAFDPKTRRATLSTFGGRYRGNPQSFIISGLYATDDNRLPAVELYRHLIIKHSLDLVSDKSQSPGGMRVWQKLARYPDIKIHGFNTRTNEPINIMPSDIEMAYVSSDVYQKPAPGMKREIKSLARDVRFVASAR